LKILRPNFLEYLKLFGFIFGSYKIRLELSIEGLKLSIFAIKIKINLMNMRELLFKLFILYDHWNG